MNKKYTDEKREFLIADEVHKKEERLLSSAIYEFGEYISELKADKKKIDIRASIPFNLSSSVMGTGRLKQGELFSAKENFKRTNYL